MTCIAAIKTDDGVWMGGDSATVHNNVVQPCIGTKVFRRGAMLVGMSGFTQDRAVLQYYLRFPDHPDGIYPNTYPAIYAIEAIMNAFRRGGVSDKEHGAIIVSFHQLLFVLFDKTLGRENICLHVAVGSGGKVAMRSLHATGKFGMDPMGRIIVALKAASEHADYVRPPFHVEKLETVDYG